LLGVLPMLPMRHHARLVLSFGIVLAAATPRPADACSAPVCFDGTTDVLPLPSSTIPANAPGVVVFHGSRAEEGGPDVALRKVTAAGPTEVAFTRSLSGPRTEVIIPSEGFEEGATYELDAASTCAARPPTTTTFGVGAAAAEPTQLGTLSVTREVGSLPIASGSTCSETIEAAQAIIDVELSSEAAPYASLLVYTTEVDGKPWTASASAGSEVHRAGSWKGIGRDLVYASCLPGQPSTLAPGPHSVVMKASLPGTPLELETPATEVDLACPPSVDSPTDDVSSDRSSSSCAATGTPVRSGASGAALLCLAIALALRARRTGAAKAA
jgi:hypothetical protein